jgi:ABC-type Fe3+/spermidine/putrescine transport system ATPase subunit
MTPIPEPVTFLESKPVLELRSLSKRFPSHHAVKEVSLELARGEFFSLLGPSGCGKTTTLRMIAGFEAPTEGEVWLNGARIDHLPPYRRNVNTVFQNYALFPHLTVRGNIEFGLRRKNDTRKGEAGIAARVAKVVEQVQLEGKESRTPSELSGGERQRVALARSLVLAPDVLLLDEPLSALDPQLRKQVRAELKDLQRRSGVTFLFVTHDQEEALAMSDRIAVMNAGAIEQTGAPQEIYQRPRTKFVASFLGAMNWMDGIGVRPECMRISHEPRPKGAVTEERSSGSALPVNSPRRGIVTGRVFLGSAVQVEVRLEGGAMVTALVSAHEIYKEGEAVRMWWRSADELRFAE